MNKDLTPLQQELFNRADSIVSAIGQTLTTVTDAAKQAGGYILEQLPDVAIQYITYGRASLTTFIALGLLLIITSFYIFKRWSNELEDIAILFSAIFFLSGGVIVAANIKEFLMVWFAPKVWLLIEIANLVKQIKSWI